MLPTSKLAQVPGTQTSVLSARSQHVGGQGVPADDIHIALVCMHPQHGLGLFSCVPDADVLVCRAGRKDCGLCRAPLDIFYRSLMPREGCTDLQVDKNQPDGMLP